MCFLVTGKHHPHYSEYGGGPGHVLPVTNSVSILGAIFWHVYNPSFIILRLFLCICLYVMIQLVNRKHHRDLCDGNKEKFNDVTRTHT